MSYAFDTSAYPVDQRLGAWSDQVYSGPWSIAALTTVGFHGQAKINFREQIALYEVNLGGIVETRTKKDVADIPPEDLCLVRPLSGALWLDQGNIERTIEPGQICLRNFAVPHRAAIIALDCVCLKIPAAPLQQRLRVLDPFYEITNAADGPMRHDLLASFLDHYSGNLHQWSEDEFTQLSVHLYDLISLLILKPTSSCAEGETSVRIAHRERALAYIRANLADPTIKPISVAEACGISVRYLYEIFKMADMGVEECILDERIKRSRVLLNDPRYAHFPVSVIGQMVGFKHASHFVQLFRHRFGVTPGNFRPGARLFNRASRTTFLSSDVIPKGGACS
jgi:AraC-like DNA-binding protein